VGGSEHRASKNNGSGTLEELEIPAAGKLLGVERIGFAECRCLRIVSVAGVSETKSRGNLGWLLVE